ncbi:MAG: deoxyguanosinetriphosphate triphosphohydrolase [Deltaproteobacteria bacterium]|nr:deoxyguanosinetriphosphate triphosphohydrolase [Deltaproteobacteria bacterium]
MNLREELQKLQEDQLHPAAARASRSRGRRHEEPECSLRTAFQRDRDRILYSKAFRRLKHKTQVFLAPTGDHYRTRLTHTLEVAQIARTVARALRLNEDLTEAIALGHDLGHTPFGHAGEAVLNQLLPGGFRHHEQSIRVVDELERDGRGLNLTFEVRQGILHHSKGRGQFLPQPGRDLDLTLEAQLVRAADVMAYIAHDTDDAMRGGVIGAGELPPAVVAGLGDRLSRQIDTMVRDLIAETRARDLAQVTLSARVAEAMNLLREFLYQRVYDNPEVHGDFIKASKVIHELYEELIHNDEIFVRCVGPLPPAGERHRRTADYIAGMSDRFALNLYTEILLPKPWGRL